MGDNDKDGTLDSGDVPTTQGDVWIAGNVGIGTVDPSQKLHIVDGKAQANDFCLNSDPTKCLSNLPKGGSCICHTKAWSPGYRLSEIQTYINCLDGKGWQLSWYQHDGHEIGYLSAGTPIKTYYRCTNNLSEFEPGLTPP